MANTEITPSSPLYIHPNETTTQALVQQPLIGSNYSTWSRSMKIALIMKKKIGFVLGTIPKPPINDNKHEIWEQCDKLVFSWILNSVSPSIAQSITRTQTSYQIWKDLEEQFSTCDIFKYSDLVEEICALKQGDSSVQDYFTSLKILWEDMLTVRPLPTCECNPQCSCGLLNKIAANDQFDHIIRFLKGLNDGFSNMKNQVLRMSPLPSLNQVFGMALNAEKQLTYETGSGSRVSPNKSICSQSKPPDSGVAANDQGNIGQTSRNSGNKRFNSGSSRQHWQCSYCGMNGHTVDRCYKKHGYPAGFKGKSTANQVSVEQMNIDVVGDTDSNNLSDENIAECKPQTENAGLHMLTTEQYQALLRLLSGTGASNDGDISHQSTNFTVHTNQPPNQPAGDVKRVIAQEIVVEPEMQKHFFRGKEKEDCDYLQMAGVKDDSKVLLLEDTRGKEITPIEINETCETSRGSEAVAEIRAEVNKLAEQVSALQVVVNSGTKIDDKDINYVMEMLMRQLLKLDTVEAAGEGKVQRKMEARRIQSLVEEMDTLKVRNSNQ